MTPDSTGVLLTVLTATYNRRHTLPRLYQSLVRQTCHEFEWLIVDDGSTDGTRELVEGWQRECRAFPIRYHWKPNGGKHTAHNLGVDLARGTYCSVIDSDDWFAPDGIEKLLAQWRSLPPSMRSRFVSVEGLCATEDGTLIGSEFPADVFDSDSFAITLQRAVDGDTKGMCRTEVLREFRFPEAPGTRFVPEALVWNRIAQRYRTRFINVVVAYNEYLTGGLSQQRASGLLLAPAASLTYNAEILGMARPLPAKVKARSGANYTRFSLHQRVGVLDLLREAPRRGWVMATFFVGCALYLADLRRAARHGSRAQ